MNMVRMILKEAGGRIQNAAGSINSKDNMFAGSSGNAISDKIGDGANTNPIASPSEGTVGADTTTETTTPEATTTETPEADTSVPDDAVMSDERLKSGEVVNGYKVFQSPGNKGKLKNLDFSPSMPKISGGGGMPSQMPSSGGSPSGADMGSEAGDMADSVDAGDMADAADAASDERLKRIFGDNEDAIKAFSKINAIQFTYNDKAQEIPNGEDKGIDTDPHYGIKAQELAQNPFTESAVSKDPISDYLQIDTKELTMANTAIISEICKRILIIEKILGIKVVE